MWNLEGTNCATVAVVSLKHYIAYWPELSFLAEIILMRVTSLGSGLVLCSETLHPVC